MKPGSARTLGEIPLSRRAIATLALASEIAARFALDLVEAHHILLALFEDEGRYVTAVLLELGIDGAAVRSGLIDVIEAGETTPTEFYKTRRNVEQAGLTKTAELLNSLGRDLTREAKQGHLNPIVGRDREIDELVKIMLGRRKNNAVLIGEAGLGKTAIVEGLAQRFWGLLLDVLLPHRSTRPIHFLPEADSMAEGTASSEDCDA